MLAQRAPKVLHDRFPSPDDPINFEGFLVEYPDLLSGQVDIQEIFVSALKSWLAGSSWFRKGLISMGGRTQPQEAHLFYLDPIDATNTANYLVLLDRVFEGLLAVTGGDINGDASVDSWDLHTLGTLFPDRR
ncbi:MAG TPA: hypothetical protein PLQ35_12975 [bacterium]|nr:hypothetical protein [bacterium]HQL63197.1 hypothetical protein [bacterium]